PQPLAVARMMCAPYVLLRRTALRDDGVKLGGGPHDFHDGRMPSICRVRRADNSCYRIDTLNWLRYGCPHKLNALGHRMVEHLVADATAQPGGCSRASRSRGSLTGRRLL